MFTKYCEKSLKYKDIISGMQYTWVADLHLRLHFTFQIL